MRRLRSAGASTQSGQSSLSTWKYIGFLASHWAHCIDWSDWADAQADLSLLWVHRSFCVFFFMKQLPWFWWHMASLSKWQKMTVFLPLMIAVRSKCRLRNILEFYSLKHVSRIYHSQLITNERVIFLKNWYMQDKESIMTILVWTGKSVPWDHCSSCCKNPKYSKNCCNYSKIWSVWLYRRVLSPRYADGMANKVDPDQTAPLEAVEKSLIWVYTVCPDLSVRKLRIIMVIEA